MSAASSRAVSLQPLSASADDENAPICTQLPPAGAAAAGAGLPTGAGLAATTVLRATGLAAGLTPALAARLAIVRWAGLTGLALTTAAGAAEPGAGRGN